MKTFYKIGLITAVVSAVIGVVAICIGWAMGGSLHDYNQIGIFYDDGGVELYPEFKEFERWEENIENKFERWEDNLEYQLEKRFRF